MLLSNQGMTFITILEQKVLLTHSDGVANLKSDLSEFLN